MGTIQNYWSINNLFISISNRLPFTGSDLQNRAYDYGDSDPLFKFSYYTALIADSVSERQLGYMQGTLVRKDVLLQRSIVKSSAAHSSVFCWLQQTIANKASAGSSPPTAVAACQRPRLLPC